MTADINPMLMIAALVPFGNSVIIIQNKTWVQLAIDRNFDSGWAPASQFSILLTISG